MISEKICRTVNFHISYLETHRIDTKRIFDNKEVYMGEQGNAQWRKQHPIPR